MYIFVYASVAGWHTLWRKEQRCPTAHFCVFGICIITNNAVSVKYIPHHSFYYLQPHLRSVRSPKRNGALHCAAHFCVFGICIITNNAEPIKYRNKNPNKFLHQSSFCVFKNLFNSFPLLAAIHLFISSHNEIKDFCSMDKKTGRRYVRRVHIYT